MATIKENYVSFETAKLLKENGFDARCPMIYTADSELLYADVKHHNMYAVTNKQLEYYTDIIAPSQSMAMKWLREIHNLFIEITVGESEGKTWYDYDILPINGKVIYWKALDVLPSVIECNTPEEAAEIAIKYCLENLI